MILVSVSGGKDSTALLIWAKENCKGEIKGIFADTGWEHPITYRYIDMLSKRLEIEIITVKNEKYCGMLPLIRSKRIFPSPHRRFCTQELKIKPIEMYLKEHHEEIEVMLIGIRRDESKNRMDRYGKYNPDDLYNYRDVFHKDILIKIRFPILNWTEQRVYTYLRKHGIEPNPLYDMAGRVGCFPCIISEKSIREALKEELGRYRFRMLVELEKELNMQGYHTRIFPEDSEKKVKRLLMEAEGWERQVSLDRWIGGD